MDSYDLPSYTGLYDSKGEYVIVKLSKVVTEKVKEKDSIDTYYNEYISMIQEEIDFAFISDLKVKADIDIKLDNLN